MAEQKLCRVEQKLAEANNATATLRARYDELLTQFQKLHAAQPRSIELMLPPTQAVVVCGNDKSLFVSLLDRMHSCAPLKSMQDFVAQVITKCSKSGTNSGVLQRFRRKPVNFKIVSEQRALKVSALPGLRRRWIKKHVNVIMSALLAMPDAEDNLIVVLKS